MLVLSQLSRYSSFYVFISRIIVVQRHLNKHILCSKFIWNSRKKNDGKSQTVTTPPVIIRSRFAAARITRAPCTQPLSEGGARERAQCAKRRCVASPRSVVLPPSANNLHNRVRGGSERASGFIRASTVWQKLTAPRLQAPVFGYLALRRKKRG